MKIALDPYMHRHVPLLDLPRFVAELGYEYIELSPRADFLNWWVRPRVYPERIKRVQEGAQGHGVKLASLLPMYRWASPIEERAPDRGRELEGGDPGRGRDGLRHA